MNSKLEVPSSGGLRVFIDINDTLLRTGELTPDQRLEEVQELNHFVGHCKKVASQVKWFEVILISGNSFEYIRRVEEPLGIKNIEGTEVFIVSENGLICRSFSHGDIWRLEVDGKYNENLRNIDSAIIESTNGQVYTQGNEIRRTYKPTKNRFSSHEMSILQSLLDNKLNQKEIKYYIAEYYLDLDPGRVFIDGSLENFDGKYYAAKRLISRRVGVNIAFGDSLSDAPLFEAIKEAGGTSYCVGNSDLNLEKICDTKIGTKYTSAINYVLRNMSFV